jgi:hypothetical protein
MSKHTICDGCGKPITGKPVVHVKSTIKPPEHPPMDFDTVACFSAWNAKQKEQKELVTGL